MSEAYDRQLVTEGSSPYERIAAVTVGIAFLTLFGSTAALFTRQPVDASVGGVALFQLLGGGMIVLGLSALGLGALSRIEAVETSPSHTSGLLTGIVFGLLWAVATGLIAANTLGLGSLGWYVAAPLAGFAVAAVSILAREDVGSMVPAALLLLLGGGAVLTGLLGPGWSWSPPDISATFPAAVVVPLLSATLALVGGWTAGKAYTGFGTRGRQTGAYLLVSLVVAAVLGVLVGLLAFVFSRGLDVVVDGLSVGATTGLFVAVTLGVVLGSRDTWTIDIDRGSPVAVAGVLLRASILGGLGLLGVLFAGVLVLGDPVSAGGVTVTPSTRVGTGIAMVVAVLLFALAKREYDGFDLVHERSTVPETVRTGLVIGWLLLAGVAGIGLVTDVADAPLAYVGTTLTGAVAVALAAYPLGLLARRLLDGEAVRSAAVAPVSELRLAVTGGLGYLALSVWFEVATGTVAVGGEALGPLVGVVAAAVAAQAVAACFLLYGAVLGTASLLNPAEERDDTIPQIRLSAVGLTGALVVLMGHAVLTLNELVFFDVFVVSPFGALDWPFVMNVSQGLGIQPGVMPAIIGTVWLVVGAVLMAVPLALGAAVYLTEYADDGLTVRIVEVATNGLWSTPSIVFGLFVLAFIVPRFGNTPSLFAGQLALGFMLMPLVLITSRESLQNVPDEYRDASAALGVSKWETIRSVVIPAAMPGVITGVILGIGRIAGETAPILLVTRGPNFPGQSPGILESFQVSTSLQPPFVSITNPALLDRASALPYQVYAVVSAGVGEREAFGWGTALVLLAVVLSFYAIGIASRRYFRRKLDQ